MARVAMMIVLMMTMKEGSICWPFNTTVSTMKRKSVVVYIQIAFIFL